MEPVPEPKQFFVRSEPEPKDFLSGRSRSRELEPDLRLRLRPKMMHTKTLSYKVLLTEQNLYLFSVRSRNLGAETTSF